MKNFDFSSCAKYFQYGSVLVDIPSYDQRKRLSGELVFAIRKIGASYFHLHQFLSLCCGEE